MTVNYTSIAWGTGALLIVSLIAFAALRVHAAPHGFGDFHGGHGPSFKPHRLIKMIHHLDLSRDQHEQIGAIMDKQRPKMRTFMLDMMDAKTSMQEILNNPNYDPNAIESLVKTQAANAQAMFITTGAAFAKIAEILTPEQRQEMAKRMTRRHSRGDKPHRGEAGDHRRPPPHGQ